MIDFSQVFLPFQYHQSVDSIDSIPPFAFRSSLSVRHTNFLWNLVKETKPCKKYDVVNKVYWNWTFIAINDMSLFISIYQYWLGCSNTLVLESDFLVVQQKVCLGSALSLPDKIRQPNRFTRNKLRVAQLRFARSGEIYLIQTKIMSEISAVRQTNDRNGDKKQLKILQRRRSLWMWWLSFFKRSRRRSAFKQLVTWDSFKATNHYVQNLTTNITNRLNKPFNHLGSGGYFRV